MWHSGVSWPGAGRVGYRPGLAGGDTPAVAPVTEVSAARQLLGELFDAQQSGKRQTVQDTRDKLNALREKMGDEAFKDVLKKMIEEADEKLRAFLRQLLMQWFPDDGDAPSPAPPVQPGGGGGGRGPSVPRSGFGPTGRLRGRVEAADAGTTTALAARDIAAALDLAGAYAEVSMRRRSQETIQLTTVVAR